jgi:hypothetical protein
MICPICKTKNNYYVKQCKACGCTLNETQEDEVFEEISISSKPVFIYQTKEEKDIDKKKSKKGFVFLSILVVSILSLLVIGWTKGNESDNTNTIEHKNEQKAILDNQEQTYLEIEQVVTDSEKVSQVIIIGKTDKNAEIATNYQLVKNPIVDTSGNFQITLMIPLPAKTYDIAIAAVTPDKQQHIEKIKITQQVDEGRYIAEAIQISDDEWNRVADTYMDKVIMVEGYVASIVEETDTKTIIALNIDDNQAQQISIHYYGSKEIKIGSNSQFYGYIEIEKNQPILVSHIGNQL